MTVRRPLAALLAAILSTSLAACGSSGKRAEDRNRYRCDDNQSFSADFSRGAETVWVRLRANSFRMDRVETDVGDMYVRGSNTLTVEEGVATLALGDGTRFVNCSRPGGS